MLMCVCSEIWSLSVPSQLLALSELSLSIQQQTEPNIFRLDFVSREVWPPQTSALFSSPSPECHHPPPSPGLSPDNCQTTISTFSPQIKLEMSSAQGYGTITSQPSMSWKVAIFQHIISHSIYWRERWRGWLLILLPS